MTESDEERFLVLAFPIHPSQKKNLSLGKREIAKRKVALQRLIH
jgi:hypothetical protein